MTTRATAAGLEGVVATSSRICYLDGQRGVLAYCGYDIHDLARSATFEEVCYLLWHRRLPTRAELGDLQTELARAVRCRRQSCGSCGRSRPGTRWTPFAPSCRSWRTMTRTWMTTHRPPRCAGGASDGAGRHAGRGAGSAGRRRHTAAARPCPRARRELPVHADRRAPECTGRSGVRRGVDSPCRPRAERLDVRRACRGGDARGHPLDHRGRGGDAEGAATRRRQRRSHEDAHGGW